VEPDGEFQSGPQHILHKRVLMLWNQAIEKFKVQWKHFGPNEATWEMADQMWSMYPSLFVSWGKETLIWWFGDCLWRFDSFFIVVKYFLMMAWYMLHGGLLFSLCWFSICFMVIDICFIMVDICYMMFWYMLYDVSICLIYVLVYDLTYILLYIIFMML